PDLPGYPATQWHLPRLQYANDRDYSWGAEPPVLGLLVTLICLSAQKPRCEFSKNNLNIKALG
ncbi:MAG: hypothetical protein ACREXQ_03425, partial [Polaromonas sp.]